MGLGRLKRTERARRELAENVLDVIDSAGRAA
jgi:hypothetical protein